MKCRSFLNKLQLLSLFGLTLSLMQCGGSGTTTDPNADLNDLKTQAVQTYADIVFASYQDSLQRAQELQTALAAFVSNPTPQTHNQAKQAWLAAREPYGQTEVYRFYDGPIDNPENGPELFINAWPLDENYIDYVEGNPNAGLINDPAQAITVDNLLAANGAGGEKNISTGYHAIEFLLWGQDLNSNPGDAGLRPYSDYDTGPGGTHANQDRRGQYLNLVANLLVQHLQQLVEAWDPAVANNYRAEFLALPADEALRLIMLGFGELAVGELSGQRMQTSLDTLSQEDEHSCFSDNTHRDIADNFQGLQNLFAGHYTRTDGNEINGIGLQALITSADHDLATEIAAQLEAAQNAINQIDAQALAGVPYDEQIQDTNDRMVISEAIHALSELGTLVPKAATALGLPSLF